MIQDAKLFKRPGRLEGCRWNKGEVYIAAMLLDSCWLDEYDTKRAVEMLKDLARTWKLKVEVWYEYDKKAKKVVNAEETRMSKKRKRFS